MFLLVQSVRVNFVHMPSKLTENSDESDITQKKSNRKNNTTQNCTGTVRLNFSTNLKINPVRVNYAFLSMLVVSTLVRVSLRVKRSCKQ